MRRSLTRNKNFKKATANPECECPDFLDEFAGYIKIKNRRFPTETMFELTKLPFTHSRVSGTTAQRKSKKFYLFNTLIVNWNPKQLRSHSEDGKRLGALKSTLHFPFIYFIMYMF